MQELSDMTNNEDILTESEPQEEEYTAENSYEAPLNDETEALEEMVENYELENELDALHQNFPDIISASHNTDPERYKQLRAMGLTMKEAYLATSERVRPVDNKKHLTASMPRGAKSPSSSMTRREMELARVLFEGMSDDQIKKLYNKVK